MCLLIFPRSDCSKEMLVLNNEGPFFSFHFCALTTPHSNHHHLFDGESYSGYRFAFANKKYLKPRLKHQNKHI